MDLELRETTSSSYTLRIAVQVSYCNKELELYFACLLLFLSVDQFSITLVTHSSDGSRPGAHRLGEHGYRSTQEQDEIRLRG